MRFSRSLRVVVSLATNTPIVTEEWLYLCLAEETWIAPTTSVLHPRFGRKYKDTDTNNRSSSMSSKATESPNVTYYSSCSILNGMNVYIKTKARNHTDPPTGVLVGIAKLCGAKSVVTNLNDQGNIDVAIIGEYFRYSYLVINVRRRKFRCTIIGKDAYGNE